MFSCLFFVLILSNIITIGRNSNPRTTYFNFKDDDTSSNNHEGDKEDNSEHKYEPSTRFSSCYNHVKDYDSCFKKKEREYSDVPFPKYIGHGACFHHFELYDLCTADVQHNLENNKAFVFKDTQRLERYMLHLLLLENFLREDVLVVIENIINQARNDVPFNEITSDLYQLKRLLSARKPSGEDVYSGFENFQASGLRNNWLPEEFTNFISEHKAIFISVITISILLLFYAIVLEVCAFVFLRISKMIIKPKDAKKLPKKDDRRSDKVRISSESGHPKDL